MATRIRIFGPAEITLPSGQVAYRRGLIYSIRQSGPDQAITISPQGVKVREGPSEVLFPSGQRAYRTSQGAYTFRRPRRIQAQPVNPKRIRFNRQTGQYYEAPSHPEQAARNPGRFRDFITRQETRQPGWFENVLRKNERGRTTGWRMALQEIAEPGRHSDVIEYQRSQGDALEVMADVAGLGPTPVRLTAIERLIVSRHKTELQKYLDGKPNELWRFQEYTRKGGRIGAERYELMTSEFEIDDFANRGELSLDSMYSYMVSGVAA
jgi:hypothetical protein